MEGRVLDGSSHIDDDLLLFGIFLGPHSAYGLRKVNLPILQAWDYHRGGVVICCYMMCSCCVMARKEEWENKDGRDFSSFFFLFLFFYLFFFELLWTVADVFMTHISEIQNLIFDKY